MSCSFDFTGKKILVTGASQGIGYDLCKELAKSGAHVYALARTQTALNQLAKEVKNLVPIVCDVAAPRDEIASALAPHQPFDGLVNNAGVTSLHSVLEMPAEDVDRVLQVNLRAPIILAQLVAREMIAKGIKGAIVNMSSQASQRPLSEHVAYSSSKAGLDMATRVMARELGAHGIRVNCVNPTVVLTEMGRSAWSDPAKAGPVLSQTPLGRFAETSDVASAVLFLLSSGCPMTTGAQFPVDGGYAMN